MTQPETKRILATIREHANAYGMTRLSHDCGIGRTNLYRILSEKGNPTMANLLPIMQALDLRLGVSE